MTAIRGVLTRQHSGKIPQFLHALLLLILPAVTTIVAIVIAAHRGVTLWQIGLLLLMYIATMAGITVGMHRLLAHRAFDPNRPVFIALAILGSMAAQGPPIYWASNHRRHHAYTDGEGDLHSPHQDGERRLTGWRGLWHAHVGWTFDHLLTNTTVFGKDLLQDRELSTVNRYYYLWVLLGLLIPSVAGWAMTGTLDGFVLGLLWGGGVRLFLGYHFISAINSVLHVSGYRRFNTHESSRNNVWLALPTLGEGWHNNHHANATSANFGSAWWELDCGWQLIRLMRFFGWVRSVKEERIVEGRRKTSNTRL